MDRNLEDLNKEQTRTPQTISSNYSQTGSIGLERYGGYIYEEFLSILRMPQSMKVYREMASNDPTIGSVLFIYESMMKKLTWGVEAGGDKRVDKQMAEFIRQCMDDMEHSWLDFIIEVLSMFTFGWSWHEMVFKKRTADNSKFPDGRIGWAKLPIRSQNSWNRWVYSESDPDKLIGMEQLAPNVNKSVIIPYEKSLLFRTKLYRNSPEGVSLLRTAYRPWYFKKKIEELEGIGIERDLAGLPSLTTPEGVDVWNKDDPDAVTLRANLERLISNVRRDKNEGLLLPFGYEFKLESTGSRRQFDTNAIINRLDQRIAMTMLADLILMGADKSGSFALADSKKQLLGSALEAQADNIANIINTIAIPKTIKMNTFEGYTDFPRLVRGEIETPDMVKLGDSMTKLAALGMTFFPDEQLEDYLRDCLGFPEISDVQKEKIKQKAKDEAQQKMIDNQNIQNANPVANQGAVPGTNGQGKAGDTGLKPRQYETHVTDSKKPYNAIYERAGMKKFFNKILGRESE